MKFHYEFPVKKIHAPITHHQSIMMMGSCFTENIGEMLSNAKFTVLENPNGILFNPVSVAEAIDTYVRNEQINGDAVFLLNESWHSWKHHSRFSGVTPGDAVEKINRSAANAHNYLKNADYLFITLGSSWVYELTEKASGNSSGQVAANNHKAPSDWFSKRLMSAAETTALLQGMLKQLFNFNAHLQVIFTISPVRHLREGVIENNRSKAVLIQAVHDLVNASDRLYYFPAYELVIDDLRDYRFYAEDLVHPNYHATQYVWEKFTEACMPEDTRTLLKLIKEIGLAHQHKPFNSETSAHRAFLQKYEQITLQLVQEHPELKMDNELAYFKTGMRP